MVCACTIKGLLPHVKVLALCKQQCAQVVQSNHEVGFIYSQVKLLVDLRHSVMNLINIHKSILVNGWTMCIWLVGELASTVETVAEQANHAYLCLIGPLNVWFCPHPPPPFPSRAGGRECHVLHMCAFPHT